MPMILAVDSSTSYTAPVPQLLKEELASNVNASQRTEVRASSSHVYSVAEGANMEGFTETQDGLVVKVSGTLVYDTFPYLGYGFSTYLGIRRAVMNAVDKAKEKNTKIILYLDSPGGEVRSLFELVYALRSHIEASGVKLQVVAGALCCSAAYALAMIANDGVYQDPDLQLSSLIGSIGVYMITIDAREAYEKAGVKIMVFRSGVHKGSGSPLVGLTEEEQRAVQQRIDDSAGRFFKVVSQGRGISIEDIKSMEGDSFSYEKAKELNLVNGIYLEEEGTMPISPEPQAQQPTSPAQAQVAPQTEPTMANALAFMKAAVSTGVTSLEATVALAEKHNFNVEAMMDERYTTVAQQSQANQVSQGLTLEQMEAQRASVENATIANLSPGFAEAFHGDQK